jgi:Domain of unknown function (DUF5666)
MRKFFLIAAAAVVSALLPLGAAASPPGSGGSKATDNPRSHWFAGSVTGVGSDSLSLRVLWTGRRDGQLNGQSVSVAVTADTTIVAGKDKHPVSLSSIQNGDLVGLTATSPDKTLASLTATRIHVFCNCHWVGGTISSIGSGSFSVQVARTGPYDSVLKAKQVTLQTTAATIYIRGKAKTPISFSDLKVGDGVGIVFAADGFFRAPGFDPATATFTAKRVHVWGKKDVPPPASDAGSAAATTP